MPSISRPPLLRAASRWCNIDRCKCLSRTRVGHCDLLGWWQVLLISFPLPPYRSYGHFADIMHGSLTRLDSVMWQIVFSLLWHSNAHRWCRCPYKELPFPLENLASCILISIYTSRMQYRKHFPRKFRPVHPKFLYDTLFTFSFRRTHYFMPDIQYTSQCPRIFSSVAAFTTSTTNQHFIRSLHPGIAPQTRRI